MQNLQATIFPYLLKEYLTYFIIFLGITVLVLFVTLIVHKVLTEKRDRIKRSFAAQYSSLLSQYIDSAGPLTQRPESNLQFSAFADVCIDMLRNVPLKAAEKIKLLLKESGTVEHFRRRGVLSSSWPKRFYAMEVLGFFMLEELIDFFKEVINNDSSPEVKTKALWAWSLIAREEDIENISRLLVTDLSSSSKYNVYIFTNVISSFRKRGVLAAAVNYFHRLKEDGSLPTVVKRDLIEACGASGLKESAELIKDYFHSSSEPLMKIACIRALGATGCLDSRTAMLGLADNDWRVRAVTAKAAHEIDAVILKKLQRLLYDFVYIVRINSAKKLAEFGAEGRELLEGEKNSGDRFVRDTVRYILEEVGKGKICSKA